MNRMHNHCTVELFSYDSVSRALIMHSQVQSSIIWSQLRESNLQMM